MERMKHLPFIGCDASLEEARGVLFGAPFDGTTSFRPGTRFGPQAMRTDSYAIETYSPYQDKDLEDLAIADLGDLVLPHGNPAKVLDLIQAQTQALLDADKVPIMLGGEHLVTLGAMRAIVDCHPDVHVVHFDAHTDLREDYLGEALSHATVIRRVWDLVGDGRIHQFGIRSGEKEEFLFGHAHNDFHPFHLKEVNAVAQGLKGKPLYLTLDLDVLDPSIMAGTGTKEAGGVSFQDLHEALLAFSDHHIVGFDMVELSPLDDPSGVSTAVACKLLREMILAYLAHV